MMAFLVAGCGDDAQMVVPMADAPNPSIDAAVPAHVVAYVSGYGPNIAWLDLNVATGALTAKGSIASARASPSYLAMTGTHLYAASEGASRILAYAIDPSTGALAFINDQPAGGSGPAHISVDRAGKFVLVANYGDGKISVLKIRGDGGLDAPLQTLDAGANAHQILTDPTNTHVLVPCKGANYVAQYLFDATTGRLTANGVPRFATANGAGPRHLAFAPDGAHAYLVNELDSTLVAMSYDGAAGRLAALQTVSTRAAGATGNNTGAEIAVHPSGKWVWTSNRGDNNLAAFTIASSGMVTAAGHTPTGGMTPRAFAIDPSGTWLFAANQGSSTVTTFRIEATTGALTATGTPLAATQPSFVGFVGLP